YSVIMLAFSGITIAVMVKDDAFSPTESPFAKALSVKLLIVIIPIALAAYNRFRLMPQLKADPQSPEAWTILRKTVLGELIAIIAILIVTGVLVLSSPAVS
ncbi:MAG: CopD family protein, partial [Thermomicrobiales bacterium]|nr:CopD family protein [Thermomicrobiales bacterium]